MRRDYDHKISKLNKRISKLKGNSNDPSKDTLRDNEFQKQLNRSQLETEEVTKTLRETQIDLDRKSAQLSDVQDNAKLLELKIQVTL
jgi:hypothetical protein